MSNIIWISGISGTGKSTLAKFYLKFLNNFLWIDGDEFRRLFNNDLGYTLKDRNKNAKRLINFVEFINKQNISIIVSANLTSTKYQKLIKKKFKNLVHIKIFVELGLLEKRDKKGIYNKKKNVVGKDILIKNHKESFDFDIYNNSSKQKFLLRGKKILKNLKIK